MKFNLNNKGFSFSPYLMIVMMFLGIIMAFHFMVVDSEKAVAIAQEGNVTKNALQAEGTKSAARNLILLSAYDYIDRGLNRPDLQVTPYVVGKINPLTNKLFTFKDYLEKYISLDLNSVASEGHKTGGALGSWGPVTINELDEKGKVRSDGFLVSAEGTYKVEKFVDSGVFAYYDKYKNYNEDFFSGFYSMLKCKLAVSCKTETKLLTKQISCSSSEPQDYYGDANEIIKRIKEALIDLAKMEVRGTGSFSGNKFSNAPITYNVDYIDATVKMSKKGKEGECCRFEYHDKYNECVDEKYDYVYVVTYKISGRIHFKELNLTMDATAKETGDGFEVCVMHTLMTKDGNVKALQFSEKDFDRKYEITISYTTPREPQPVITEYAKLSEGEIIPNFKMNEDSLKYNLKPVKCEWGPSDAYTPACPTSKGALRKEYEKYSKCKNACYYDINVPNEGDEWYCPGEEDPYYPKD
jgi:hypothetical protein